MKTIIAGSRTIGNRGFVCDVLDSIHKQLWNITEVVSGTAKGPDLYGEWWAENNNIHIARFAANWKKYGKRAGILRNQEMAQYADALIAFWDGSSKGTQNMMSSAGIKPLTRIVVVRID